MKYDQHENCVKCGYPGKTVEYKSTQTTQQGNGIQTQEWLVLTCSRCKYQWSRDCLDKQD